ncbi:MAG TPA: phosphate signaling complex protein PhoU [Candidatus Krumholzibacteria bacterium]|jgi:phosphate transport system protein|nr:phosphate signaling complex protein PhoU [Candidatus Krumholzibacteria bacterium]
MEFGKQGSKKRHFERELDELKQRILRMGGIVEDLFLRSIEALSERDRTLLAEANRIEAEIDAEEVQIEEDCLKLVALYQPVAGDLRFIASVLKINAELERMGDLALHIAERAHDLAAHPGMPVPPDLRRIAADVQRMVRSSLESLVHQDSELALQVLQADHEVDDLHRFMFQHVAQALRVNPDLAEPLLHLLSASRHLERIADSATNIAEDVYYLVEGQIIRHRAGMG